MKNKLIKLSLLGLFLSPLTQPTHLQAYTEEASYIGSTIRTIGSYVAVGAVLYGAYTYFGSYLSLQSRLARLEAQLDQTNQTVNSINNRQLPAINQSIKKLDKKMDDHHRDLKAEMRKCCQQTWADIKLNELGVKMDNNHKEVVGLLNRNGFIPTGDTAGLVDFLKSQKNKKN